MYDLLFTYLIVGMVIVVYELIFCNYEKTFRDHGNGFALFIIVTVITFWPIIFVYAAISRRKR